ncbi:hypothetical protein GIB67_017539, partial [Kingdonia uniflora]
TYSSIFPRFGKDKLALHSRRQTIFKKIPQVLNLLKVAVAPGQERAVRDPQNLPTPPEIGDFSFFL